MKKQRVLTMDVFEKELKYLSNNENLHCVLDLSYPDYVVAEFENLVDILTEGQTGLVSTIQAGVPSEKCGFTTLRGIMLPNVGLGTLLESATYEDTLIQL